MSKLREESLQDWDGFRTLASIDSGSLQRIADAAEKMAAGFDAVLKERDQYKREAERYFEWWQETKAERDAALRTINGLRGQIARLMRRIKGGAE